MNRYSTFQEALSLWTLALAESSTLSIAAAVGLEEDLDSPSLRMLAGLTSSEPQRAPAMLEKAVSELGLRLPERPDAARYLAKQLATRIVAGELDAFEGARDLAEISRAVDSPRFHDLDAFVYADSEAEDRPEEREFFRTAILSEARRWVG